jgi:hypothetical protein
LSEDLLMEDAPEPDESQPTVEPDRPRAARAAIWHLFEEGRLDEDAATVGLLALDMGCAVRDSRGAES